MSSRVVITAAEVVSPVGRGLEEVFAAIGRGIPGIGIIGNFDSSAYPSPYGAEVKEGGSVASHPSAVDRKELFLDQTLRRIGESASFNSAGPADRSLHIGAGLDYFDLPGYMESTTAGKGEWQDFSRDTLTMARSLARRYGIRGEVSVNVTACVASSQALGLSYRLLKRGAPGRLIVSGGVDSMLNPLHFMGFQKLGALSSWEGRPEEACRPFDRRRCGLVLGEGAALFVLQRADDALPGSVLAEIAGYASTMDAHMVTDPDPTGTGLAAAARKALHEAGLTPDGIDCVHLHATGTLKNEPAEAAAMRLLFPDRWRSVPVYSMKGQVGHLIAGCGAMEMVGVLYSILTGSVPPTVNFRDQDPEAPLRVVTGEPLSMKIRTVLKLNAAFGGQNTALVVKRHET
jgi:3-oxoacyl-[acyl-carrier-protein] synthase II